MSARARQISGHLVLPVVIAALALGCAAGLYLVVARVGLPIPLDPNEGWNAYHAQAAISAGRLYPGPDGFMINNYPPLSFYLAGALGLVLHDNVVAGRVLSLAAFAAIAGLIAVIARRMKCSRPEAAFAALIFAAYLLGETDYVGMDDPQLLAHALDLATLLLVLRLQADTRALVLAALGFVVAGFVKHNLVAVPLAVLVWLALADRRRALWFAGAGLGFALLGLAAFRLVYGTDLLAQIDSSRTYSVVEGARNLLAWLGWGAIPLAALMVLTVRERGDRAVALVALMALCGVAVGAVFMGGAGVDLNAMFDADIALALGSALLINRLWTRGVPYGEWAAVLIAAPLAVSLWFAATPDWLTADFWFRPGLDNADLARGDIAFLRTQRGPALCETLSFCYWAGKQAEVDVFNLGEAFRTQARDDGPLVRLLERKYFRVVEFETLKPLPLTANIQSALARNYRLDHADDNGFFFVPR